MTHMTLNMPRDYPRDVDILYPSDHTVRNIELRTSWHVRMPWWSMIQRFHQVQRSLQRNGNRTIAIRMVGKWTRFSDESFLKQTEWRTFWMAPKVPLLLGRTMMVSDASHANHNPKNIVYGLEGKEHCPHGGLRYVSWLQVHTLWLSVC
jgi:hypothetical protein